MLRLVIGDEVFDNDTNQFSVVPEVVLDLEHSLVSLSKWESKYQKPFLGKEEKTVDEMLGYIFAMLLTPNVGLEILPRLSQKQIDEISMYMQSSESATTFGPAPESRRAQETITSELIYYWMVAFSIPFEAETWHLNRLLNLIKICTIKNSKPSKTSKAEAARQRAQLNEARKQQYGTSG